MSGQCSVTGLPHLPQEIACSIARYDAMVASGEIVFGRRFADAYDGHDQQEASLREHTCKHTRCWPGTPVPPADPWPAHGPTGPSSLNVPNATGYVNGR